MIDRKVKVGDQIAIYNSGRFSIPYRFDKIKSMNATQVVTEDGTRWMLRSGRKVGAGESWYADSIAFNISIEDAKKANAEWTAENEMKILRRDVANASWRDISDEKIRRIKAILDEK